MDVLGQTPAPATSIDACLPDGFVLGDGSVTVSGGAGALLVAGEAFAWRPWHPERKMLVNARGQWDLGEAELESAFAVLGVVWPRPGKFPNAEVRRRLLSVVSTLGRQRGWMVGRGEENNC